VHPFARAASFAAPAALRSRIIASTSWRRERTIAFFSMSKTVLVEREAACILYRPVKNSGRLCEGGVRV